MTASDLSGAEESATRILRREGRSFHWASRFLPGRAANDAAELYAFCRMVDDLGDDTEPAEARRELDAIARALQNGASERPEVGRFLAMARRRQIPLDAAKALVEGVRRDLEAPVLTQVSEVVRYSYRVAGTVGLMMCPILGVRWRWAQPFAVDLGIAMQLTNIARDVVEDADRGRRYVPAELFDGAAPRPCDLTQPDAATREPAYEAVVRLLDMADRYYASADRGMGAIPARPRLAIITARRVYAGIGDRIRAAGPDAYWNGRASVSAAGKLRRTVTALAQFAQPASWPGTAAPDHEPGLHAPIADLPGTDSCLNTGTAAGAAGEEAP